ncbi:MAG: hypothetical protein BGO67_10375 [Alphaproteobacteria bacterium 41-28]|nr:MAG: hypothetical protein BGO67_10375 [Alphaproteobacteria bacterium 41-28]
METNGFIFTEDIYTKHLGSINDVKFTPREIDVMACLLSARRTSQIASMLSIAPRTVTTHFRNIMLRLDCNSQEGIINFVERSHKLSILREYYSILLIELAFQKSLKEISKLKKDEIASCLIVYWQDHDLKNTFLRHLENHLSQAGIIAEIREHGLDQKIENTDNSNKILLFLVEKKDQQEFPSEWSGFVAIDLSGKHNYYFSVFELLQKLLPSINLDKTTLEFKERFEIRLSTFDQTHLQKELSIEELRQTNKNYTSYERAPPQIGSAINEFVSQEDAVVSLALETESIRSDLFGPATEMLLQRPQIICQIEEKLRGQQGIQTIALIGPGGAGKTTIARQYGRSQKSSVVWEINAETKENLINSFECFASALSKTEEEKKILKGLQEIQKAEERGEKIISFVKERLKFRPNWLLLYDNVEKFTDIQKCFPSDPMAWGQGKIIVTTRNANIKNNNSINQTLIIGELDQTDRLSLFTKIMDNDNIHHFASVQKEQAQTFLNEIPPFPLDVSIAAYYLKATNISYAKYLEKLGQYDQEFEDLQECILRDASEYNKTRYNIVTLSLKCLMETHKDFMDLLLFISLLDSKCILRDLLVAYKGDIVVDNFIYNLKKYSFLTNESCNLSHPLPLISIHRSTQEISLAYLTKTLNLKKNPQSLQSIVRSLENYIDDILNKDDCLKLKFLVSHCEIFLSHMILKETSKSSISRKLGYLYYSLGYYNKAISILKESLLILNKDVKNNYDKIANILVYLGNSYRTLGDYKKAKSIFEQSLKTYKKHPSVNNTDIAWVEEHLGAVYLDLGDYEKARNLLEQSLSIYKNNFLENYVDIARAEAFLGILYRNLGNYSKAEKLLEKSLITYKKHFSENSLDVLWIIEHLGSVYTALGDYEKARELVEPTLKIYKEYFPENQIDIAGSLHFLGNIYCGLGDYVKAQDALENSHILYLKNYGRGHIKTANILISLGQIYLHQGDFKTAEKLISKSLRTFQKNNHPDTFGILEDLALLQIKKFYFEKNKGNIQQSESSKRQAINNLKQAQEIIKLHFPKDSHHIVRIQSKLKKLEQEVS